MVQEGLFLSKGPNMFAKKKKTITEVEATLKPGESKFFQSDKGPAMVKKGEAAKTGLVSDPYTPEKRAKVITKYGYETYSKGKLVD